MGLDLSACGDLISNKYRLVRLGDGSFGAVPRMLSHPLTDTHKLQHRQSPRTLRLCCWGLVQDMG